MKKWIGLLIFGMTLSCQRADKEQVDVSDRIIDFQIQLEETTCFDEGLREDPKWIVQSDNDDIWLDNAEQAVHLAAIYINAIYYSDGYVKNLVEMKDMYAVLRDGVLHDGALHDGVWEVYWKKKLVMKLNSKNARVLEMKEFITDRKRVEIERYGVIFDARIARTIAPLFYAEYENEVGDIWILYKTEDKNKFVLKDGTYDPSNRYNIPASYIEERSKAIEGCGGYYVAWTKVPYYALAFRLRDGAILAATTWQLFL